MNRPRKPPYWKLADIPPEQYYESLWQNRLMPKDAIVIGETAEGRKAYITPSDLMTHLHVMGPTGAGKSKLLELLARHLIDRKREAVIVLDPNEDLVQDIKAYVHAVGQSDRLLLVDLTHPDPLLSFNPMARRGRSVSVEAKRDVQVLMRVWGQQQFIATPRMANWLYNVFYALRAGRATYFEALDLVNPEVSDLAKALVRSLPAEDRIRAEWDWMHGTATPSVRKEHLDSSHSRLKGFLMNDHIKFMVGQLAKTLDPARVIDEGKILLVNLQEGEELAEDDSRLLGTLFFSAFTREAISRPRNRRVPFTLIADEFYQFISFEAVRILTTGRKYRCSLILAHQYPYQLIDAAGGVLDQSVLHAVLASARTKVVFGDLSPEQYRDVAEKIAVKTFDPYKVKQELRTLRQLNDGFEEIPVHSSSRNRQKGGGMSAPVAPGIFGAGGGPESGYHTEFEQSAEGDAEMDGVAFLPRYKEVEDVRREFVSFNEHLLDLQRRLISQADQHGCLIRKQGHPVFFRVSQVQPPAIAAQEVSLRDAEVLSNPQNPYTPQRLVMAEIAERHRRLLATLRPTADAVPREPRGAPPSEPLTHEQSEMLKKHRADAAQRARSNATRNRRPQKPQDQRSEPPEG